MKTIEIYLKDLTPEKQEEVLKFYGDGGDEDIFDTHPLAILETEKSEEN